jgi:nicotinic acid mononucleotide adenylyltransferase
MGTRRAGGSALLDVITHKGWKATRLAKTAGELPPTELDSALRLALDLAGQPAGKDVTAWHEPLFTEARRRLYPDTFPAPTPEVEKFSEFFFPLAQAVLEQRPRRKGGGIGAQLPFVPLTEEEIGRWPSGEEYRRMVRHVADDALLVCLAMAQEWEGLTIYDHVLGVTGLSLFIGRQLADVVPVDLPLLHGAAIGHDVGKFGCVGDEVTRIPRLHYYYTHTWYQDRNLLSLGHIATNHSVWDLELVRLPIETLLLIYADFRVKGVAGPDGNEEMRVISLRDAFKTIRDKLEELDKEKLERYRGVYHKLRDLEEYLQYLGVKLNPSGFECGEPPQPRVPEELDLVAVLAGRSRPDAVALVTGRGLDTVRRLLVTAHNLGVMEQLRDLPALRALLEEARSFESWRGLRTYVAILGEYAPALSREQKALALDFFVELLNHRDDDIRYHAANRIGDLLAGREDFWRKDLPEGVVLRPERTILDELGRVLALLDRAKPEAEEDMRPTERVLYAVPIVVRRLLRHGEPETRRRAWELVKENLAGRLGDQRPLVGLYLCETLEVSLELIDPTERRGLLKFVDAWSGHPVAATRLMAWRLLLALAEDAGTSAEQMPGFRERVQELSERVGGRFSVAELFLLEEMATACGLNQLAERCRRQRVEGRDPVREVLLRNLKSRVDWVEKKVNCDYLTASAHLRHQEGRDPGSYFANEVASHFANLLKVSRVEGTRFHAGRCLLRLLPLLTVPQRNDLTVELLRSLELDIEAVTRYIPRFLGSVLASLPEQEFLEALDDIEGNVQRGNESLQRLLLQTIGWILLSLQVERLSGDVLRRLTGMLLGSLVETRPSTAVDGFAQIAMVLERLSHQPKDDGRLREFLALATKKLFSLVTHRSGDRVRFFLVASALNHLDRAVASVRPAPETPGHPSVAFIPGTFDPFTIAHQAVVNKALENAEQALVQIDDYSWRKHALPRQLREELAWMALATVPEAFLAPFQPPINLASKSGLAHLRRAFGTRRLLLVVGSDVLGGASAYADSKSPIFDFPHVLVMRDEAQPESLLDRIEKFRGGVAVVPAPPQVSLVSSTSLRATLDHHEDLESLCHPLVARTVLERRLYVNYPAQKEQVVPPEDGILVNGGRGQLPPGLQTVAETAGRRPHGGRGPRRRVFVLTSGREERRALAALAWRQVSAASLPVMAGAESPSLAGRDRLVGQGALVEAVAAAQGDADPSMWRLISEALTQWLDSGLLFALMPPPSASTAALMGVLRETGAVIPTSEAAPAVLRLTNPLVLLWDVEGVLQPPYAAAPAVRGALAHSRRAVAEFFAGANPGNALLHLHEEQLKRSVVKRAKERLADEPARQRWVVLGLGRQFSRDIVGDVPTLAIDLERYLTWQGYEGGTHPLLGSPALDVQVAVASELGRRALLLAPFLDSPEAVVRVVEAAKNVGLDVSEVLVGVTSASVRAALELRGIAHSCSAVVPGWQGVLRESAVAPYVGGWSIVGREPLETGSLLPSLPDCLPYHYPHHLGLSDVAALDFSRLALHQARTLLLAIEDTFRETEGRLLSVRDLGAVIRTPRCPPLPEGFLPPRDRFPSELVAEDIEALARLHPATHEAHRERWRDG